MQNQKLCLKWNHHMSNILSLLGSFQQKDMLVDVTISCQGQSIKAHKIILSACSPYFQNILMENPCQHPIIIINGMQFEDINAILNFMYKGEVNVSHDKLSSLLQAAEALKVKGLAEVYGEKKDTNFVNNGVQRSEFNRPQRTDTPPRKRPRNKRRSLSDSNKSDDEGPSHKHRESSLPEVHELFGDESLMGDNSSNEPSSKSISRVSQSVYSRSHQSSSNMGENDEEYDVELRKMFEQTNSNICMTSANTDNIRIEHILGNATEIQSSSTTDTESLTDIKPIIHFGDQSSAGPSEHGGTLMLHNEQSQPGPSNAQDIPLLQLGNSHAQGILDKLFHQTSFLIQKMNNIEERINIAPGTTDNVSLERTEIPAIAKKFPLQNLKQMEEFENFIHIEKNYKNMINFFKGIGGDSVYYIVTRVLKRVMCHELAEKFSLLGAKGKRSFKILLFAKAILDVTRFSFKEVTEAEVDNLIANWLRQAKQRKERALLKQKAKEDLVLSKTSPTVVQLKD